jgi:alkylhydroperoxidase/carboxymuconolactone decarboxylase family protein YurZ
MAPVDEFAHLAVDQILTSQELTALRDAYHTNASEVQEILRGTLPEVYRFSGRYVQAIYDAFYNGLVDDNAQPPAPREALSVQDRERCIVALLASQGGGLTLALHAYIALMEGVEPGEIANIILLAGIYTGVNRFAIGLLQAKSVLVLLARQVRASKPVNPMALWATIAEAFRP